MHPWSPCGSMYDATFQSSLYPLMGRKVSVQTIRGSVTGRLTHIQSDHVVVQSGGAPFYSHATNPLGRAGYQKQETTDDFSASLLMA